MAVRGGEIKEVTTDRRWRKNLPTRRTV